MTWKLVKRINILVALIISLMVWTDVGSALDRFINPFLILYVPSLNSYDIQRLANFDVLVLNRFNWDDVGGATWQALKKLNPRLTIYLYQLGPETNIDQDEHKVEYLNSIGRYRNSRGHPMGSLSQNSDLFLKDSKGELIFNKNYPKSVLMDFGLSSYQNYWIVSTKMDILNQPWKGDGVFVDNCVTHGGGKFPLGGVAPKRYQTPEAWNAAMNSYVCAVTEALRNEGQKVFVNRGGTKTEAGYQAWLDLDRASITPDIVFEEGAFAVKWGPWAVQFYPEAQWVRQVEIMEKIKNSKVAFLSHTKLSPGNPTGTDNYGKRVTFSQVFWYSLCSYLLGRRDNPNNAYFMFGYGIPGYKSLSWFEEYERINLGASKGKYKALKIDECNIYYREFEKGYVFVNPTLKKVSRVSLPLSFRELSPETIKKLATKLDCKKEFNMEPHTGVILEKCE